MLNREEGRQVDLEKSKSEKSYGNRHLGHQIRNRFVELTRRKRVRMLMDGRGARAGAGAGLGNDGKKDADSCGSGSGFRE
eukprot:7735-Hanusia_phi.AAC.2